MKKIISGILATILIFSVLSVSTFATDSKKPLEWYEENGLKCKISICDEGEITEHIISFKNGKIAICMNSYGAEFKAIFKNNTLYLYLVKFPFIHIAFEADEDLLIFDNAVIENAEYIRTYTSEEYIIEEYAIEDLTAKFYYNNNNELKIVKSIESENRYTTMEILETGISDSEFDLPILSFNIMPIINFLNKIELFIF